KSGDSVIFIPPDAILPKELHEELGVTKYCAELPVGYYEQGIRPEARRVKATRLRGEPSYGIVMDVPHFDSGEAALEFLEAVQNNQLDEYLGITKWEPPEKILTEDQEQEH